MRAIAPRGGRTIEARLTGFAWSPMRVQRSTRSAAPLDPALLELAGAAGAVINKTPNGQDAGVGYLIIDRDADAVEALQDAAQRSPNDAKIWSDLAAARYTLAVRGDKPYELPRALAAADHALRIDANLPDALFNRALIIEHLGITEAARRAWHRYLQADGTSKWADEALQHLGRLEVVNTRAQFERELGRARGSLAAGDSGPIAALTRTFPQEARVWGEGVMLAEWADAMRAGEAARAKPGLEAAREIGRALAETNGEQLLKDAVAVIDRNANDPARLALLAEAYATYRDGRVLYGKRRVSDAAQHLERAVELFAAAGSPMVDVARYYVANTRYDKNRIDESLQMLETLKGRIDSTRYRALDAQIDWEIALCSAAKGAWAMALRSAEAASRTFSALGEQLNRANTDEVTADMLAHMAQSSAAWKRWVTIFPAFSRGGAQDRIRNALAGAIQYATANGEYDAALALADMGSGESESAPHVAAFTNANRARLLMLMNETARAEAAIRAARESIAAVRDPALRTRAEQFVDVAESIVLRPSNPARSRALLDQSVAFLTTRNDHYFAPDVYLQRGRTRLRQGDEAGALADFQAGIAELNAQRASVEDRGLRGNFYDISPDLFADTVALLLRRGDTDAAFGLADSARAQSLNEQTGVRSATSATPKLETIRLALPPDTALVEYVLLAKSVAIFCLSRDRADVVQVPAESDSVRASSAHFRDLLQRRASLESVQSAAASLHRILIGSVAQNLREARHLIVVPDRELNAVPFAALYDPASRRYLIEDYTISVAPSAALLLHKTAHSSLAPALIIGDPKSDGGPALPDAAREAQAIAAMYDSATLLVGDRATRARFLECASRSALIHYAGHAESDDADALGTLRLASDDPRVSGALDASDIASLTLRNAPLVVLAGCGTIRGDANHVEGMPSVARAFLAAGARNVIGTLWEIDDDIASRLFRRVHQQIRAGQSPAAALRAAQLELTRSGDARLSHPSSWAPIQILGN
jgi:CHAT domain-containing protein/predicted negative regulator of RcsB-dependent stress response